MNRQSLKKTTCTRFCQLLSAFIKKIDESFNDEFKPWVATLPKFYGVISSFKINNNSIYH